MMAKFSSSFVLNAVLAATCLAAPGGRVVAKPQPGNAQLAVRDAAKKPTAKRKLGGGSSATLSKAPKKSASAQADVSLVAALQKQIDELTGALTSHVIKQIDAPARGKSVKHRAFLDLNGRGSLHLLGAQHGDIFSVNGEWHTIDTTVARAQAELAKTAGAYAYIFPENHNNPRQTRIHALEYRFGIFNAPGYSSPTGFTTVGTMGADPAALSSLHRATIEHHKHPGVRLFSSTTGFTDLNVKRVGKLRKHTLLQPGANTSAFVAAEKDQTFKVMVSYVNFERYDRDTSVVVYFENAKDGTTTKVARIPYQVEYRSGHKNPGAILPLLLKAPTHGAYTFKLVTSAPAQREHREPLHDPQLNLRVEQIFESQTSQEMADELGAWKESTAPRY